MAQSVSPLIQIGDLASDPIWALPQPAFDLCVCHPRFEHGCHGLVDIVNDTGVRVSRSEYDSSGRLVAHIDPDGNRIEYNHDLSGRQEIVRDRRGNVTVIVYDASGNVLSETNQLGQTITYTYDSRAR